LRITSSARLRAVTMRKRSSRTKSWKITPMLAR
jgi:hypothetical protein